MAAFRRGPVMGVPEVFDDPQVKHRGMVLDVPHDGFGTVRMLGFPLKVTPDGCAIRRPAPRLGEHNRDVFSELGYGEEHA